MSANLEGVVAAAAATMREVMGDDVVAKDVAVAASIADVVSGEAVVVRCEADGGPGGGLAVAIPAESGEVFGATETPGSLDAFLTGGVEAIGKVIGEDLAPGGAAVVDASAVADGVVASFSVAVGDGDVIQGAIVIESPLGGVLIGDSAAEIPETPPADMAAGPADEPVGEAAVEEVDGDDADQPTVAAATLPDLGTGAMGALARDLNVLADVAMTVTVELGRTKLRVRDLLSLVEGSVVELDQPAGSPVDILVNGTAVARGDVVVVGEDLGVRITEVIERTE